MTLVLILTISKGSDRSVVYTDAYLKGLGCLIMQNGEDIAYESRQLKEHDTNYLTRDLGLAAVTFILKILLHYLYGLKFDVYVDNKSLKHWFRRKN